MSDDITFCGSDCKNKKCFRHPSNIREPRIPHSFAYLKGTENCPMKKQEVRLIEANALKEYIKEIVEREMPIDEKWSLGLRYSLKLIDNAPTVDIDKPIFSEIVYLDRPKGEFNKEDFKRFVEGKVDMQDLYLPVHLFMLLDEYLDMRGTEK